jgi:NTP pyrophosphatase (non-canonical NTP hydrolase)
MTFKKQTPYYKKSAEAKYKKAIKQWGEAAQINMIIEESAELSEACSRLIKKIMKLGRCKNDKSLNMAMMQVESEIADVHIMIEQAYHIFDSDTIRKIKNEKLRRLEKLLEGEKL